MGRREVWVHGEEGSMGGEEGGTGTCGEVFL